MKEWLRAGTIIGTYQILMRVGVSGLGEVYRARDEIKNIDGALKLLPSSLMWNEESARRFVEILKTSPTLQHACISKVLDAGIDQDGRPYAVTEYVRGQSLDEIGIGLARTMAEKIYIAIQVAEALECAHQQGVLHLSLKPSNIMLTSQGGIKVLDFVVSLATQVALMLRGPNAPKVKPTIGSVRYHSPEQVRGEKPTKQSDVFSLGTVCYELFTGQLPFSGRSVEEVNVAIVRDQPMPLTAYAPDAHPTLNEIILKALEKDPAFRYQTAGEVAADLKALVAANEELKFAEADANEKAKGLLDMLKAGWKWLKEFLRQYIGRILIGMLLMLLALGSGTAFLYFQKEDNNFRLPTGATPSTRVTNSGRVTQIALSPGGTSLAYVTENANRRTLLYKETTDPRDNVLAMSNDADITGITFSLDGEWIYYVKNTAPAGELYVCSVHGGISRKVLTNIAGPVTFSPSNKEFAFVRLNGAETKIVIAPAKTEVAAHTKIVTVAASPTPATLAAGSGNKAAATPSETPLPVIATAKPNASPGLTKMVIATNIAEESLRTLAQRNTPEFIQPQTLSWSHDGKTIAAVVKKSNDDLIPQIVGFNPQSGEEKPLAPAPGTSVEGLAWLANDANLLVNARALHNSQRQLWKIKLADGKVRELTEDHEDFLGLSVSMDGQKAISIKTSRSVSIWLGTDDKAKEITNNNDDGISGLAWFDPSHIVHVSRASGTDALWMTPTDGLPSQFIKWARFGSVDVQRYPYTAKPGQSVYFTGLKDNKSTLYQVDLSDQAKTVKPEPLTTGAAEFFPQASLIDGSLFYTTYENGRTALLRADGPGNPPVALLEGKVWRCSLSPDGKMLAANYFEETTGKWKIIVFPSTGGQATGIFDAPGDAWRAIGWMPDGNAIAYVVTQNGISNLWQQPVGGGTATPFTTFTRHRIYDFAWSPDGKQLAVVRGRSNDDAMLLEALK